MTLGLYLPKGSALEPNLLPPVDLKVTGLKGDKKALQVSWVLGKSLLTKPPAVPSWSQGDRLLLPKPPPTQGDLSYQDLASIGTWTMSKLRSQAPPTDLPSCMLQLPSLTEQGHRTSPRQVPERRETHLGEGR